MITKKRVKKDVQVIETKKKYVTVYKLGGIEDDTHEEAKTAMREAIGEKLKCFIRDIADDENVNHGYWQTMKTFYREINWHGGDVIVQDKYVKAMNELIKAVNEYNQIR